MFSVTLEGEAEFAAQVAAFTAELHAGAREAVLAAVKSGQAAARAGAFKDRTGALRDRLYATITEDTAEDVEGEIWASQPYASYVENDTEPHEIRPRKASALRWEAADGVHFSRLVHHPGTKSIPFMGPAYLAAERTLHARMEVAALKAGEAFK